MVDFNESEGESAFLVVRSTKGVWFDNPHVFHRSLAKVPISFCFAEGAQVQTELGPTASVKVGGYFASSADYEEWYQRRRASLTLPPSLGAEVRTFTPGWIGIVPAVSPSPNIYIYVSPSRRRAASTTTSL